MRKYAVTMRFLVFQMSTDLDLASDFPASLFLKSSNNQQLALGERVVLWLIWEVVDS